jgi:digeranylgeranylglycerophospholipid reductase
MAKKYDVIVVGAGPAGLMAAKAAGEDGFEVALLERKPDLTVVDRACGHTLDSANEYLHHDLYRTNIRDKRLCFPAHGFSVKYDGPYKNAYAHYMYSPSGNRIRFGVVEEEKGKGDYGRTTAVPDKEILLRCLLDEAKAYSVEVFHGINVEKVTSNADGVKVEGSGQSFDGSYLIAADGINSRIAHIMGMNEGRNYLCQLRAVSHYASGLEVPDPEATHWVFAYRKDGASFLVIVPRPFEDEYIVILLSVDPRVDLRAAEDYFFKEAFCAPWFKNVKILRTFSANENCYSPIVEACKGRVLIAGDVGATQELEITGAMISGWKAGHAVAVALQEENLGLEVTALSKFADWWKEAYINYYSADAYMANWGLPYILTEPEEVDYLFSLLKEPMHPSFNPYTMGGYLGQALAAVIPTIQQEKPEMLQKLGRMSLPAAEIFTEVTKVSKPVS